MGIKVLVTGGLGFIGTNLVRFLEQKKSVSKIIPNFSSTETFTINGKKCKNYLFNKNKKIFEEINNFLYNNNFNSIHGDPTLSNILIKKNLKPIFFDPRGYFANKTNILGDKYYDFSNIIRCLVVVVSSKIIGLF